MSITAQRVRELVANLPDAAEGMHHGHPDFRVKKKIFATLSEAEDRAALRLTHIEARALAERSPEVYRLVSDREPIGWVSAVGSGALYYASAYWFYLNALRAVPASFAAVSFYLIPIFGMVGKSAGSGQVRKP